MRKKSGGEEEKFSSHCGESHVAPDEVCVSLYLADEAKYKFKYRQCNYLARVVLLHRESLPQCPVDFSLTRPFHLPVGMTPGNVDTMLSQFSTLERGTSHYLKAGKKRIC